MRTDHARRVDSSSNRARRALHAVLAVPPRGRGVWASILTLLLLITVLAAALPGAASAESSNLIGNPGFEVDTAGWRAGASSSSLTRVAGGRSGSFAAQLSNSSAGAQCALEDEPRWVRLTQSGTYSIGIWVRSDAPGRSFKLRVREYAGGSNVGSVSTTITMTSAWQQVSVAYTPASPGNSSLDLQGYTSSTPVGVCFEADDAFATLPGATNTAPVANGDAATTESSTPVRIDVLANDSDPDNDPLTVTGATAPGHGSAVVNADNSITYTPASGYSGPDAFSYSIADGRGGTASASVSVTVGPSSNRAPVANGDSATTATNTPVAINVLANDADPDNDALRVTGATVPGHGSATVNANNTITYAPAPGYFGPDAFNYSIADGRGGGASASVTITVNPATDPGQPYDFAALGDVPYSSTAVTQYRNMIAHINAGTPRFSVHVGDIGPGSSSTCTRTKVDTETARFDTFARPLVFTPGDNEWTDCDSASLAQLDYIRSTVYRGTGTRSRGQTTIALESQASSGYPENARWHEGPVTYATVHVVGGSDNRSNRSEHDPRRQANIAWVRQTFAEAKARGSRGVVLFSQRDPKFSDPSSSSYGSLHAVVRQETLGFGGQVLYIHGDGHSYINDRPLSDVANLRRLQVEGSGKVSYVKVRVEPSSSGLFVVPAPTRF